MPSPKTFEMPTASDNDFGHTIDHAATQASVVVHVWNGVYADQGYVFCWNCGGVWWVDGAES